MMVLKNDIAQARWFQSKSRSICSITELDQIPLESTHKLTIIEVHFTEGPSELYALANLNIREGMQAGFCTALVNALTTGASILGRMGTLHCEPYPNAMITKNRNTPVVLSIDQSNSSAIFPDQYFLKLYGKLEAGIHPEIEMGSLLQEVHFPHIAPIVGSWTYESQGKRYAIGMLQQAIPSKQNAWNLVQSLLYTDPSSLPQIAQKLGQRTAKMHIALHNQAEPFSKRDLDAVWDRVQTQSAILKIKPQLNLNTACELGKRIRIHGDLHLGQILATEDDFVFVDFEGEPARPLADRRQKRSPLCDVAGMLRSFDYATMTSQDPTVLATTKRMTDEYLEAYLATMQNSDLLPPTRAQSIALLRVFLLEKALYEVAYEKEHRPDWLPIPMRGLFAILKLPY